MNTFRLSPSFGRWIALAIAVAVGGMYGMGTQLSIGWMIAGIEVGPGWLAIALILAVQFSLAVLVFGLLKVLSSFREAAIIKTIIFSAMVWSGGYLVVFGGASSLSLGGAMAFCLGGFCAGIFSMPALVVFLVGSPE